MFDFICPIKDARLTSKFGWRNLGFGKEWHQGIDLASTGKVPIYASADGIVIRTGILSSYGNVVMIRHNINGKRMDTNYAHLDSYCVKVGQTVKQGQQIGIMGMTGRSYGIHLHFEIHNGAWATGQPNAVDPMKYIDLDRDITSIGKEVKGVSVKKSITDMEALDMDFTSPTLRDKLEMRLKSPATAKLLDETAQEVLGYKTKMKNGDLAAGDLLSIAVELAVELSKKHK